MKNLILIIVIVFVSFSCSKDKKFDASHNPQKWVLVKMNGQVANSETSGKNMEWQEYYLLNSDGTFIKHRERDGIQTYAEGSFSFADNTDGKFLELNFDTNSEIIGSCYEDQTESLWLRSETKLTGTWSYCDGPGLEYKRVE